MNDRMWQAIGRGLWQVLSWILTWLWDVFCFGSELLFGPLVSLGKLALDPMGRRGYWDSER